MCIYDEINLSGKVKHPWQKIFLLPGIFIYIFMASAGDQNFYHFYVTHRNVQEIDGNLHEPLFDIDGDGIGVFGSAVVDTIYLTILKE